MSVQYLTVEPDAGAVSARYQRNGERQVWRRVQRPQGAVWLSNSSSATWSELSDPAPSRPLSVGQSVAILTGIHGGIVGRVTAVPGMERYDIRMTVPELLMVPDGPTHEVTLPYGAAELVVVETAPQPTVSECCHMPGGSGIDRERCQRCHDETPQSTGCTECQRPTQGRTGAVPQVSHDGRAVVVPEHECKQCWEHCAMRAYVLAPQPTDSEEEGTHDEPTGRATQDHRGVGQAGQSSGLPPRVPVVAGEELADPCKGHQGSAAHVAPRSTDQR